MRQSSPVPGIGFLLLATAMAGSALLGPLGAGIVRFRVSDSAELQLLAGEAVSLALVAPLAILTGILFLRRHRLAPVVGMAPALYAAYTYPQYIVGPDYTRYTGNNEQFFVLYLMLVILGWTLALRSWRAMRDTHLPSPSRRLRRTAATLLLTIGVLVAAAWAASIWQVVGVGLPSREYRSDPTLFWFVRLLDLGFVVPASFFTAAALVRHADWSRRLAYAMIGFQTLLVATVAAMALVMTLRHDPSASPAMLLGTLAATTALALCYAALLRRASHVPVVHPRSVAWQVVMRPAHSRSRRARGSAAVTGRNGVSIDSR